jgi:hypothetical protein
VLDLGRGKGAPEIGGDIVFGLAGGDGVTEDHAAILQNPVRVIQGASGLNPPADRQ